MKHPMKLWHVIALLSPKPGRCLVHTEKSGAKFYKDMKQIPQESCTTSSQHLFQSATPKVASFGMKKTQTLKKCSHYPFSCLSRQSCLLLYETLSQLHEDLSRLHFSFFFCTGNVSERNLFRTLSDKSRVARFFILRRSASTWPVFMHDEWQQCGMYSFSVLPFIELTGFSFSSLQI